MRLDRNEFHETQYLVGTYEMELVKSLLFIIRDHLYLFKTLSPEHVTESYINFLRTEKDRIENNPDSITIEWQTQYIEEILGSSLDTICGLFMDRDLIGTSGIQNVENDQMSNRYIQLAVGSTYDSTLGILVLDQKSRGKGYGKTLVWASCYLASQCGSIKSFKASVKKDNAPSLQSFLTCGFRIEAENSASYNVGLALDELLKPEFISDVKLETVI